MDGTQDFDITLPLMDREAGIDRWLREEVLSGHAEYLADPGSAVPVEDVLARIKARRLAARAR